MTLSEELTWRGFANQTTFKDVTALDGEPITFYWGVDPSADSMTVGNLAIAMMVKHFIRAGHKAVLLVGGATGLIGDPDGKSEERTLKSLEEIAGNKTKITEQYQTIFGGQSFDLVDNYDWFKDMGYLEFLRDVGKHVPLRQMLSRDFVQARLGEGGAGISYAEFSYSLIQGYDFLHLHREMGVSLQVCGADQWGNCIAGVELVRRITGNEAHIWSAPLVINKTTGKKFGKTEGGAVWLDPTKTSPAEYYQFWVNSDDAGVEEYLKIYTMLSKDDIEHVMAEFTQDKSGRAAQKLLAFEATKLVHGEQAAEAARIQAESLKYRTFTVNISDKLTIQDAADIGIAAPFFTVKSGASIIETLHASGLATSKSEARQLLADNGVYVNDQQVSREFFEDSDFQDGKLALRRGKKLQNTKIIVLEK